MSNSVKDMLSAANSSVPKISPQDAAALIQRGQALVVDVRDGLEIQSTGKVQGAKHVARGMLEFRADPDSPYYDKEFSRDKTVIVYCASGGRSALAGKTLHFEVELIEIRKASDEELTHGHVHGAGGHHHD